MKIYAKYFHGFDPIDWPAVTFSLEAAAQSLVEGYEPGSRMVFLATRGAPDNSMRGKIVGMMEFGQERGRVEQYFTDAMIAAGTERYGTFQWPWAVKALRAWQFDEPYSLTRAILGKVPMKAIRHPWLLPAKLASRVLRLPHHEVPLSRPFTMSSSELRKVQRRTSYRRSKGPPPTSYEALVIRSCDGPCFTYLLRFGARDIWKIGISIDPDRRLAEINAHVPTEVLDEQWQIERLARFENAMTAYDVEQAMLDHFRSNRTIGERISLPLAQVSAGWDAMVSVEGRLANA
ncbi:GIY-YIG nuclease family protein [Mesorhizobium silamurunense]|uniref:GIY-YIG nuclease family protein n=1 Tax=Mesorhizobium silamurunense TaxID=499528 RepID=UPI00177FAD3C|nr:GIY-YIG nuclease family protein [Mesorhizobium silamurunense]